MNAYDHIGWTDSIWPSQFRGPCRSVSGTMYHTCTHHQTSWQATRLLLVYQHTCYYYPAVH